MKWTALTLEGKRHTSIDDVFQPCLVVEIEERYQCILSLAVTSTTVMACGLAELAFGRVMSHEIPSTGTVVYVDLICGLFASKKMAGLLITKAVFST